MGLYYTKLKKQLICISAEDESKDKEGGKVEEISYSFSTNSFCLTSLSKVFLSFVKGLLSLLGLARLYLGKLDVEASYSASNLLRARSASVRDLLSCSTQLQGSV